ncbi:hypothetical protein Tco_0313750 [Tanacetum coccineum]
MSFSKRQGNDAVCYTKPLDSLKSWNNHFFWVDAFVCPASFSWNTSKSVSKDLFPKSSEFNAKQYATLVAYPALFHKYLKPFLCLIGISRNYTLDEDTYPQFLRENGEEIYLLSFIQTADPKKVRVGERQRAEDEPKLLDTTVGRVVPLLPIAPARAESELDASVDSESAKTVVEDVAPLHPRRQRKRKIVVPDAGGSSHPPKKLREDHGTLSVTSVGGKSRSAVQRLLAGAVQNAEVRGEPIPTLPFVTSFVSTTPEREYKVHTDSATGLNLQTIGAPQRFVISSDSSHHSGAKIVESEVDSFARPPVPLMIVATTITSTANPATTVKEKFVESSIFSGDSSGGGADHTVGGFSDLTGSDFIVGSIRTVISPDTDLQKVYVPQWSVTNGSYLDDGRTCREMVNEFAPPKFFASIRGMEHDQLFTEFNVGVARQISLSAEVRMRAEYNIRERRRLNSVVEEKNSLLKARDVEIEKSTDIGVRVSDLTALVKIREQEVVDLDAQVIFAKSQSDNLADRVHELETSSVGLQEKVTVYENFIDQLENFQDEKMKEVNEKFDKLSAISKAVEKGTQEGLSARITHGVEGRTLTDVAAYDPSAENDYLSALQRLQSVNFSLIAELKTNKDASINTAYKPFWLISGLSR